MYRWFMGHQNCLSLSDLLYIVPDLYKTLLKLHQLVLEKRVILIDSYLNDEQKTEKVGYKIIIYYILIQFLKHKLI